MKKLLSLLLAFTLTVSLALAVGCSEPKGDVKIKYYKDGATVVQMMNSGAETIGLIPEPAVSNIEKAFAKQNKAIYKMDLQELYDSETKAYPQAVLMVKKSVITESLYENLNTAITNSVAWAKQNPKGAVLTIKDKFASTLNENTLTGTTIDNCKIYFEGAEDATASVKDYIDNIRSIEEQSANVVSDDFFYSSASGQNSKDSYTLACPDGAPALAVSKLISDGNQLGTGKTVNYKVVAAAGIKNEMTEGISDIILMPINLATKFYSVNANDPYVMVAVITHGNFYIMSMEEITVDDLKDKQIAVPNMGAVPDWTIRYVLQEKGYNIGIVE